MTRMPGLSPVTWLQFTHYPCQLTYQPLLTTSSPNLTNIAFCLLSYSYLDLHHVKPSSTCSLLYLHLALGSERLVTVFLPCLNHWPLLWNFPEVFHLFLLFSSWLHVFIFGHTLVACLQFPVVMTLHDLFLSSTLFASLIIDSVYFHL